jgi:hypothetical protein
VAAESATFGLPEVPRGIFAAAGGVFRLPEQPPRKIAMEMIFTGEPLGANRALGLANRVVPADEVVETALALAERICANAPLAVQASKGVALGITDGQVPDEDAAWAHNEQEIRDLRTTHDASEGPRAFAHNGQDRRLVRCGSSRIPVSVPRQSFAEDCDRLSERTIGPLCRHGRNGGGPCRELRCPLSSRMPDGPHGAAASRWTCRRRFPEHSPRSASTVTTAPQSATWRGVSA